MVSTASVPFAVDSRKVDTGETQITVVGEIDLATAPLLDRAISHHTGRIVVDLRKVSFMDSTAIRVLLIHRDRLKARGGDIRLLVKEGPIPRLIEMTGLADILQVDTALHAESGETPTTTA
jgi:anti-sigma B factor antagonist